MIEVEILLPPIAVGETVYEKAGEIIELTEADVLMWEKNGVVKRVAVDKSVEVPADNSGAPESPEKPTTTKKR